MISRTLRPLRALAAALLAACASKAALPPQAPYANPNAMQAPAVRSRVGHDTWVNEFQNPGFETGSLPPWYNCSTHHKGGNISTYDPYAGKYDALGGTYEPSQGEIDQYAGICQIATVPRKPYLTVHLLPLTDDLNNQDCTQLVAGETAGGSMIPIYATRKDSLRWLLLKAKLNTRYFFPNEDVLFFFGTFCSEPGSGRFMGLYVDNVSLTSS